MESGKMGPDEPVCRAGIEMQTERRDRWAQWVKEKVG